MKQNINQIRQEFKMRFDHVARLMNGCFTLEQLYSLTGYWDDLRRQSMNIVNRNIPYFAAAASEYYADAQSVLNYYSDRFSDEFRTKESEIMNKNNKA